jgi:hypothetical protein
MNTNWLAPPQQPEKELLAKGDMKLNVFVKKAMILWIPLERLAYQKSATSIVMGITGNHPQNKH